MTELLNILPEELIVYCFTFLNVEQIPHVALTCKFFHRLANDNEVWKSFYTQRWGPQFLEEDEQREWKSKYVSRKDEWRQALPLFKTDPMEAVKMLIKEAKLGSSPDEIAQFLRQTKDLDKRKIGTLIGEVEMIEKGVLKSFCNTFLFAEMELDVAFRNFLLAVSLPPSTKKIQMILVHFSDRYYDCNPSHVFSSADGVYTVTYAMLMLNTDLHNGNVKTKLKPGHFISSIQEMNECKGLSTDYIQYLYDCIKEKPLIDSRIIQYQQLSTVSKWRTKISSLFQ